MTGRAVAAALLLAFAGAAAANAPERGAAANAQERLSVVSNGEVVGYVAASHDGPVTRVTYHVDNNGRGPKHESVIETGAHGIPVAWRIEGTSLMGGSVEETYRFADGRAAWKSQADSGEVAAELPPLYIVNDGSPWALGVYARALLQAPSPSLPVLPAGALSLAKLRELSIGEGEAGVDVTVYRIGGVDLAPDFIMLDADNRLFAAFGATSFVVREGYEFAEQEILALGRVLEGEHARALQERLAHRYAVPLRIENVRIFDPESGKVGPETVVVVDGERIARIGADATTGASVVIDGEGGTLVPGLHDMHSHSSLRSGLFYLAAGVTATRDMGNRNDFLPRLMAQIEAGEIAGPRITPAGFIEGRSEYSARLGIVADSQEDAVEAVRWYADRGYPQIKIYNSMNPDWLAAMAAEAHRLGLSVTGHVPAFTTPDAVIRAGYDEIAHVNQLMLGWLLEPGEDTRTPLRLTAMIRAAELDLDSEAVQDTIALMKAGNIAHDPTAVILERLMLSRAGTVAAGDEAYLDHMPIGYQRYRKRSFVDVATPEADRRWREAFQRILDTLYLLHENGIRLLPGTDDGTGFTVHRELELFVQAGLSPAEALRLGTLGAERHLGRDDRLGSIEAGKLADFFLVAGDPTDNIRAIRRPRLVIKGGVVYFPDEIYRALDIEPFTTPPPLAEPEA